MPKVPTLLPGIENTVNSAPRTSPLWKGPEKDGVTSSLLGRYLADKERFRILAIECWGPQDHWNHRLEYGNMWHKMEEAFASEVKHFEEYVGTTLGQDNLDRYTQTLWDKYPMSREDITHYYNICKTTFPLYVDYWSKHPDVKNRTPIVQEHTFNVPYHLPSGRVVVLRGKQDSIDVIADDTIPGIYVQENKTKSTIDAKKLSRQLKFDLQTMLYLVALVEDMELTRKNATDDPFPEEYLKYPVLGVRYNVIRRSMHKCTNKDGGYEDWVGNGKSGFNARLAGMIKEKPKEWFDRWKVDVSAQDIQTFKTQCLNPVLENLVDDYEWWGYCAAGKKINVWDGSARKRFMPHHCPRHFRLPYGVYNPTLEGGDSDYDNFLDTGSTMGLRRVTTLFPELEK